MIISHFLAKKITTNPFSFPLLLFSKSQKRMLSWNPILTKNFCGFRVSRYKRTRNEKLPLSFGSLVLRMSDCPSPTLTTQLQNKQLMHSTNWIGFYGRFATLGCWRRPWGWYCSSLGKHIYIYIYISYYIIYYIIKV